MEMSKQTPSGNNHIDIVNDINPTMTAKAEHPGFCISSFDKRIATIGGTFDALHEGHDQYIKLAFSLAEYVVIYLNSDKNVEGKKKYAAKLYEERLRNLQSLIIRMDCENRCEIRRLDRFEEVKSDYLNEFVQHDKTYMAIVSQEYLQFFLEVNNVREGLDLKSILILIKPRLRNGRNELSSYSVRNGLLVQYSLVP